MTLREAIEEFVVDDAQVYIGNFGAQLFAVGHEIIRQRYRHLDLVASSGGILMDQLLGAGVLKGATFGHCWNPVGPAPAWNFRRARESGSPDVVFHELSLGMLNAALTAGAWEVPFMPIWDPSATGFGTDDWTNGFLCQVESPFGNTWAVRSLSPDIAFVHVDRVDRWGNGYVRAPVGEAVVAAQASTTVVLVAEEVTDLEVDPVSPAAVPGVLVSAVVHAPGAVYPDGAAGRYGRDVKAYEGYAARSVTPAGFESWLDEHVREVQGSHDRG